MLKNPNFTEAWAKDHTCTVIDKDGIVTTREVGNIFVPPGWRFWFRHDPGTWDQPEGRDAHKANDPHRVKCGEQAFMYFSFFRNHDAGLYQQVEVTPGDRVELSAWAHAWSNANIEGHKACFENARCSCGAGEGAAFVLNPPPLTGDPWSDAIGNSAFQVGIDPLGGDNPFAPRVVWGDPAYIYNTYAEAPHVEAVAQSGVVTIFLRNTTLWPFKHNDAYWDCVRLDVTPPDDSPDDSPDDPPDDSRGLPRVQYDRTYVLLPPAADAAWARAAVAATWDAHRYTVGGSADDAGIGDLDTRRVIAVNPHLWPDDLVAFFDLHYPGIEYQPVTASTPARLEEILAGNPTSGLLLCQKAPQWAGVIYADGCQTIGAQGCWLCCMAMAARHFGTDPGATPATIADAVGADGFYNCQVRWTAMPRAGLEMVKSTTDQAEVRAHLNAGGVAFVDVYAGSGKHFCLVTKHTDGRYWMYDPLRCVVGWLDEQYDTIDSWRLILPNFPSTGTSTGLHDAGGVERMRAEGWRGIGLAHYAVSDTHVSLDFTAYPDVDVYVRLNYGYADGKGTIAPPRFRDAWIAATAETINRARGVAGFIVTNEANNPTEWPGGYPSPSFIVSPQYLVESYNLVCDAVTVDTPLTCGALDPYNVVAREFGQPGDPADWAAYTYHEAKRTDFIAMHAKTQGADPAECTSYATFTDAPLVGRYMHLRTVEDQIEWIPAQLLNRQIIVTELNPQRKHDGTLGWDTDGAEWVAAARAYFEHLLQVRGLVFYRYDQADAFGLVWHDDILNAIAA